MCGHNRESIGRTLKEGYNRKLCKAVMERGVTERNKKVTCVL